VGLNSLKSLNLTNVYPNNKKKKKNNKVKSKPLELRSRVKSKPLELYELAGKNDICIGIKYGVLFSIFQIFFKQNANVELYKDVNRICILPNRN
jgi:hypothetical protein